MIGEEGLGENARREIEEARRDPRLDRDRGAIVADFWNAFEEAERTRTFGIAGLHELRLALERTEADLGVSRDDDGLPPNQVRQLQAAWERAEMARAEIDAGHPQLNAHALLAINSALDAFVEELAPAMRDLRIDSVIDQAFKYADAEVPEAVAEMSAEMREAVLEAARSVVERHVPEPVRLRDKGTKRYEAVLETQALGAPKDRPLPDDMAEALTELTAIRDVLVHRAGRIDQRALNAAPSLRSRYSDGQLVRITRDDYRRYSAAARCYGREILYRTMRDWPIDYGEFAPDLADWRRFYRIGS